MRLFLDASVIFAAVHSNSGASREITMRAAGGSLQIVVSQLVLEEVKRNLVAKNPDKLDAFYALVGLLAPEVVDEPSKEDVLAVTAYTALKDAPIVAAAMKANPDYLVTLDRKHLIRPEEVASQSGLKIVLPEVIVRELREHDEEN